MLLDEAKDGYQIGSTLIQGRETIKAFPLYTVGTLLPFLVPALISLDYIQNKRKNKFRTQMFI
jgi:hypothetical protein